MRNHTSPPHGIIHPPGLVFLPLCLLMITVLGILVPITLAQGYQIDRKVFLPTPEMHLIAGEGKQGVLLSHEEYQRLIKEASPCNRGVKPELPLRAAYESVTGEGLFLSSDTGECVQIDLAYRVRVLSATWNGVPFTFKGTAPIQLEASSRWLVDNKTGHLFLYGSGTHMVSVRLLVPVKKEGGKSHFSFEAPRVPSGSIQINLTGRQEVRGSVPVHTTWEKTQTVVKVSMGGNARVELEWFPAKGREFPQETAVFAQSHLAYSIQDGVLQITGSLGFSTLAGDLPETVSFVIPPNGNLRKLAGASIRDWQIKDHQVTLMRGSGEGSRLDAEITIEVPFSPGGFPVQLPVLEVPHVTRHYGEIAVVGSPGLRLRIDNASNLEGIDTAIFFGKEIESKERFLACFRFFTEPVALSILCQRDIRSLETVVDNWVEFRKDAIHFERKIGLIQLRGETPRVTLKVPQEEEFASLVDAQGQPVELDIRQVSGEQQLQIELTHPLKAGQRLAYVLQTTLCPIGYHDLNRDGLNVLAGPVEIQEASSISGLLVVGAKDSLQLTDLEWGEMEPAPKPPQYPNAIQSFSYRGHAELLVHVSRKPAETRAQVLMSLLPKEGFLSVHGEVTYFLEGGEQKEFQLAFPKGFGNSFFPESELISERAMAQTGTGDVWNLILRDEVNGEFEVYFHGEIPMNGEITSPEVSIPGARRERGYIIVEANTQTEIEFKTEGLSSLDPTGDNLPRMRSYTPSRRLIAAFEYFVHPYSLLLNATRHTPEPVLSAMADSLALTTVLSKDGLARSQAVYALRGVRIPFLSVNLPEGSELWTARVAGEPVKPMKGEEGSIQIPLGDWLKRDTAVEVGLVYETRMEPLGKAGSFEVFAPKLLNTVPVAETTWKLYLPEEYLYSVLDSDLKEQKGISPDPLILTSLKTGISLIAQPNFLASQRRISDYYLVDTTRQFRGMGYMGGGGGGGTLPLPPQLQVGDKLDAAGNPYVIEGFDTSASEQMPSQDWSRDLERAVPSINPPVLNQEEFSMDGDNLHLAPKEQAGSRTESEQMGRLDVVKLPTPPPPAEGVQQVQVPTSGAGEIADKKESARAAGLLPLDIQLGFQGVEYVFRDLRAGEHISMGFRRVESQYRWDYLKVLFAALLFFLVIRERSLLRRSVWAVFILSTAPFVLGDEWTPLCNQLLMGVFLGVCLAVVVRIRDRWLPRAGQIASLLLLVMGSAAYAETSTVYIPYNFHHPESATAEARYWLPYEDFTKLWKAAKANLQKTGTEAGPVAFSLDRAEYVFTVRESRVTLKASYRITHASGGWVSIPFPFERTRIESALLDGQSALLEEREGGCWLHLEKQGPHLFEVVSSYPCKPGALSGAVSLKIPPVILSTVKVILPREQLGASIQPRIGGVDSQIVDGHKEIVAAIGNTPLVEVRWYPEASRERPPVPVKSNIQIQHSVVGQVENWKADVTLHFQGEKRAEFLLQPDPSLSITSVQASNLASWTQEEKEGQKTLQVQLLEEVADTAHIQLTAERVVDATHREVPLVLLPDALETTFRITLFSAPWLDLRVETTEVRRAGNPGVELPNLHTVGAFETESPLSVLRYEVLQRRQETSWRLDYLFQVSSRKIEETVLANLEVRKHPLFRMSLAIPAGYRCERIEGPDIKDWWQEPGEDMREARVQVDFRSGLLGATTLIIHLVNQSPEDLDILSIAPVRFIPENPDSLTKVEGTVVIASHRSVTPHPVEETGLVSTTLCDDQTPPGQCQVGGKLVVMPPLEKKLAYRAEVPRFSAKFRLDRTPYRYGVVWVTLAEAHETWISYSTHIQLKVLQGSIRTWEFLAPASLGEIEVQGDLVREVSSQVEGESRRYKVQMDSELFSETSLVLTHEVPIQGPATVPHLSFPGVERSNGYLLTANDSSYELKVQPKGALERAQRSDIPFLPRETGILDSFKVFREDWNLELDLARTVSAETLDALIDWVDMETLIRRDGTCLTQASIRISNKSLQFLSIQLPKGADLLSLNVAGEASGANTTQREGESILLVPLIKTAPGQLSFVIEVVYELTLRGPLSLLNHLAFEGPKILDIPVAQTLWTFYVPEDYEPYWLRGNMEETTQTLREYSKLASLEEERQQLKALIVGDYDLSTRRRAYENYEKASEQVVEQQTQLLGRDTFQEAQKNRRLKGKAGGIQQELGKTSQKITSNIQEEDGDEFRTKVEILKREVQTQEEARKVPQARFSQSSSSGQARGWFSNLLSPTPAPSAPQQAAEYQQISSNTYFYGAPVSGTVKGVPQARGKTSQYLNLSQSGTQQDLYESRISASNSAIVEDLGLQREETSFDDRFTQQQERFAGAGQFQLQSDSMQIQQQSQSMPETPSLVGGAAGLAPGQAVDQAPQMEPPRRKAESQLSATGAYSIPVRFPREGNPVTFKKLHSEAKVEFYALDHEVSGTTLRAVVVLLTAVLLWAVMTILSWPSIRQHIHRRWFDYIGLMGVFCLIFTPVLGMGLLAVWLVIRFGRVYIRSFTAGPVR